VWDFTLTDQDGGQVKLSDYAGRIVVLEWTNPECPYVKRHYRAGTMVTLAKRYDPKGVAWLAINSTSHGDQAKNKSWHTDQALPYPVLDDRAGVVGRKFKARATPHMFIIDASGKLVYEGAIDDDPDIRGRKENPLNYVEQALDQLLAGEPVGEPKTRAYGCSVKYAK